MKKLNQNHYYFLDMFLLKSNILLKKTAFYLFTLIFEFPAFLVPSGMCRTAASNKRTSYAHTPSVQTSWLHDN